MKIDEKISMGRQFRSMQMRAKEESDEGSFLVEGYATTFNQAYRLYEDEDIVIDEMVDAHAFDETDMNDVIFQYNHEGRVFARTRNNTLSCVPDEHGLLIKADLGGTEEGRKLCEEIRGGYTDRMSFGFTVSKDKVEEVKSDDSRRKYVRSIIKIGKLYDVSAVSIPANDFTEISARAFCEGVIAEAEAERLLEAEKVEKRKRLALKIKLMEV